MENLEKKHRLYYIHIVSRSIWVILTNRRQLDIFTSMLNNSFRICHLWVILVPSHRACRDLQREPYFCIAMTNIKGVTAKKPSQKGFFYQKK